MKPRLDASPAREKGCRSPQIPTPLNLIPTGVGTIVLQMHTMQPATTGGWVEAHPEVANLVTTRSSRIVAADAAAARLLRRSVATLEQKPLAALVPLDDRAVFRSRLALFPDGGRVDDWQLRLSGPDGDRIRVVASVASEPTPDAGTGGLRWTLVSDPAPNPPRASAGDAASEEAQLALGRELTQLAHDLNQPLAAIVTYVRGTQLRMQSGQLADADLITALEAIAAEAIRASTLVRELSRRGGSA